MVIHKVGLILGGCERWIKQVDDLTEFSGWDFMKIFRLRIYDPLLQSGAASEASPDH